MLKSKTIDRICCFALVLMLVLTCAVWAGKASAGLKQTVAVGYEGLFDQSVVHTIDIEMDDWDSFIASATQEAYTECSVTIDGEKVTNVGIRGKGNTSLSSVATMGSQKYSFKIEFDQFVKGRSYKGLDKLSLNNLIYDATMMKDYLAYTLMEKMDVPSPLCSYAQITVNGEPWGLYLAVEGVEDGFLERNNMTKGELYKPDSMSFGGGRGNGRDFDFDAFKENFVQRQEDGDSSEVPGEDMSALHSQAADAFAASTGQSADDFAASLGQAAGDFVPSSGQGAEGFDPSSGGTASFGGQAQAADEAAETEENQERKGNFSFGGFGMGSSDVKLQYTNDDPDSYANIFDNAKTDIGKIDKARLVEALKTLSGESPRDAVFTDEVIRYLAVHDFLQNADSYTGSIVHNYYLYEENGRLAILPWDYNLAFGAQSMVFGGSDATALINSPIDSPVATANESDRPLIAWVFEDDEALTQYHEVYGQFISEIIESGWLEGEIGRVSDMIRPYVENDTNSFFTVEEFDAAVETLQSYCTKRGESIRGQLDGTIPSTTTGQRADSASLVDASELDISSMGSMGGGGFGWKGGGFSRPDPFSFDKRSSSERFSAEASENVIPESGQGRPSASDGFNFSGSPGTMPAFSNAGGIQPEDRSIKTPEDSTAATVREEANGDKTGLNRNRPNEPSIPDDFASRNYDRNDSISGESWLLSGVCVLILLLAIVLIVRIPSHNH